MGREKEQLIITFFGQTLNDFNCRGEFCLQAASVLFLLLRHAGSQQRWHEETSRHLSSEKVAEKLGYSEVLHRCLYGCQPVLSGDAHCLYLGCWAVPCWSAIRPFPTWPRPSGGLFLKTHHEVYTHRCADSSIMQQKSNPVSAQGWATRRSASFGFLGKCSFSRRHLASSYRFTGSAQSFVSHKSMCRVFKPRWCMGNVVFARWDYLFYSHK